MYCACCFASSGFLGRKQGACLKRVCHLTVDMEIFTTCAGQNQHSVGILETRCSMARPRSITLASSTAQEYVTPRSLREDTGKPLMLSYAPICSVPQAITCDKQRDFGIPVAPNISGHAKTRISHMTVCYAVSTPSLSPSIARQVGTCFFFSSTRSVLLRGSKRILDDLAAVRRAKDHQERAAHYHQSKRPRHLVAFVVCCSARQSSSRDPGSQ